MLFSSRLMLANCDTTQYGAGKMTPAAAAEHFQRQLNSAIFAGSGITLAAGIVIDVLKAPEIFQKSAPLIERCHELFQAEHPEDSLIAIRGLGEADKIDLVHYLETRPPEFKFDAYGGKTWNELLHAERDEIQSRLSALSNVLNGLGARIDKMPANAGGRLSRHIANTIKKLRTQNRSSEYFPLKSCRSQLRVTFDEIEEITAKAPNRSFIYDALDKSVTAKAVELRKLGVNEDELMLATDWIVSTIRLNYVDPGYFSIFTDETETIINGNFGFLDEKLLGLFSRLKSLAKYTRDEIPRLLEKDYPALFAALPALPTILQRIAFIVSAVYAPHLALKMVRDYPIDMLRAEGKKVVGTAAWSAFSFYYRFYAAAQNYEPEWDNLGGDDAPAIPLAPVDPDIVYLAKTYDNVSTCGEATMTALEAVTMG
jgi:hypothetical protein